MTTVVTSFSERGYVEYGRRFLDTYAENWPREIDLVVYAEGEQNWQLGTDGEIRRLENVDGWLSFVAKHGHDNKKAGKRPTPAWRSKDHTKGYSYRTDALKFCRKVFVVADAARRARKNGERFLAWIDADVVTLRPVPHDLVSAMLGEHAAWAFLGRGRAHTECGFLAFRLPQALPLIEAWEQLYSSGDIFKLDEWHDSYAFDVARGAFPLDMGRDLTPGGYGHVWCDSPLAALFDHLKGDRKRLGHSPERGGA